MPARTGVRGVVLLVATVALVCLSSAEGMAPPEEVLDLHGDHHGAMELGEAKQGKVAKTVGVVAPEDPTKQNTLKVIEKLMEAPIIDPRQEKSYKAAAQQVESVKQHIKNDLMKVVKMEILSQRVSELDAKKAMGLATDADRWLMNGEKSMDGAVESSGGCADSHPGLCAGVQVQGHCGIADYAKACPLSCHRCAMPANFKLKNSHEVNQKNAEEKGGKAAAAKAKRAQDKSIAKASEKYYKAKSSVGKAHARVKALTRKEENMQQKISSGASARERASKRAFDRFQSAKANAKAAREGLHKKKRLPVTKAKVDKSAAKSTQMLIGDLSKKEKKRMKELKKLDSGKKKAGKALKKLLNRKAKVDGALLKVRADKKELGAKKIEAVRLKANAEKDAQLEQDKIDISVSTQKHADAAADTQMMLRTKSLKRKLKALYNQEGTAAAKRERLELVSKSEQKRLEMFTVPGTERKVKGELARADKDMLKTKRKMERYQVKFGHLGVKIKVPAKLKHAYAVAKQTKVYVDNLIKQLDAEQQGPAAMKLKTMEVQAKGNFKKEEEETHRLKKLVKIDKKDIKVFTDTDKKRRELAKKQYDAAVKAAKKIKSAADAAFKKAQAGIKKSQKNLTKDEDKLAKDEVSPAQVMQDTEALNRKRAQAKAEALGVKKTHADILRLKTRLGKIKSQIAHRKATIQQEYVQDKASKASEVAAANAVTEKARGTQKAAAQKLRSIQDTVKREKATQIKLKRTEKALAKATEKEESERASVRVTKNIVEDLKMGEPGFIQDAKKAGKAKVDAKIEKQAEKEAAKESVKRTEQKKAEQEGQAKAFAAVAKQALAQAASVPAAPAVNNAKCTGNEDKHAKLCGIIKNHKHCGFAKYRDYCCGSCKGGKQLSSLETSLGSSIKKADAAIQHAHKTEVDSKSRMSDPSEVTSLLE